MASLSQVDPMLDEFSLIRSGPIHRVQIWLGLIQPDRASVLRRALLSIAVTWLPLLVLSAIEGRAIGGVRMPFLFDYAANIRFLITMPLLIAAEIIVDPRMRNAVRHFVTSNLVGPSQLPAYAGIVLRTKRLCDAVLPTVILILLAFSPSLLWKSGNIMTGNVPGWETVGVDSVESLSMAGAWFQFISIPLYRLMLLRWLWLLVIWAGFLRRVSALPLYCVATHPDGAGGLGFLKYVQWSFGPVTFATSAVVAGGIANLMAYQNASLSSLKFMMIGICILLLLIMSAPLFVVSPLLTRVRRNALLVYGDFASAYVQAFDSKWIGGHHPPDQKPLGSSDIQSLADLNGSYGIVRRMQIVLMDKETLLSLAAPAVAPMLLLLLAITPADEVLGAILNLLK